MKRSHQAMFNRAYERIYLKLCDEGIPLHIARERAADAAWGEYEQYCNEERIYQELCSQYCNEKLDDLKTEGN